MTVTMVGLKPFMARLDKLAPRLRRKEPMFRKMSVYLIRWVDKNFQSQGREIQGGWPKLKSETIMRRRGGGKGVKILQDTRRGRASIRTKATSRYAKIYTRLDYMIAHHEGTRNLPQRKIIPVAKQVQRPIMKIARKHLEEAIRKSGL